MWAQTGDLTFFSSFILVQILVARFDLVFPVWVGFFELVVVVFCLCLIDYGFGFREVWVKEEKREKGELKNNVC